MTGSGLGANHKLPKSTLICDFEPCQTHQNFLSLEVTSFAFVLVLLQWPLFSEHLAHKMLKFSQDKILDGSEIRSQDLGMRHEWRTLTRGLINTRDTDLVQILCAAKLRYSWYAMRITIKVTIACYVQLLKNLQHFFTLLICSGSQPFGQIICVSSQKIVLRAWVLASTAQTKYSGSL